MKPLHLTLLFLTLTACSTNRERPINQIVDDYIQTYGERQDIDKFLGFYDDEILFEDIINGDRLSGKSELRKFLDWGNPDFKKLERSSLIVSEKIIDQNQAVIKGYFTRFQWGEMEFEPMHFTTILTFNASHKIIRQVDWINYPSTLVDYNKRKNSNEWIK